MFHQTRGQTFWIFHLKTSNLEVIQATYATTRQSVLIHSMHFVFPFCPLKVGFFIFPISEKTWKIEATMLSDFSSFLPLRVVSDNKYSVRQPESVLWDFFNTKFTLKNLMARSKFSLIDRGFAEFIFPNTTFVDFKDETCFCHKLNLATGYDLSIGSIEYFNTSYEFQFPYFYELPQLIMNKKYLSILLTTSKNEFTFLSCGDPSYDQPDFLALFMPFTTSTWVLICMTIYGWPIVLSLIENDFNFRKVLQDFDAMFIGWAMILEQSHLRATNYKGRGPLYCYCGCVLLAVFILSNAYKGDNIRALTKSFELVPLTHMKQVINAGYKKYSTKRCIDLFPVKEPGACKDEFPYKVQALKHQYTEKQYKLWEPMDHFVINNTEGHILNRWLEWFGECREKKALLGWRSGHLIDLERKLRRKHKSAHISLGEEFIFSRREGWRLNRYGSIKVLKRMWTLVESGVYNELLNISYKPLIAQPSEPQKLAIQGNIFVQFVFLSCGLLFALLTFIAEFHKSITSCFCFVRDSVGSSVKNFLQQFQKAFHLGLKYLVNMGDQLLNQRPLLLYDSCRAKTKRGIGGTAKLFVPKTNAEF